jgi:metallophosphoesterase superfamily enzyme
MRARDMLLALTSQKLWTWITGNHDPAFVDHCGGRIAEEAEVDGLLLRHEADPTETRPELSGHFPHPGARAADIAALFRGDPDQADTARLRRAHRRSGCPSS